MRGKDVTPFLLDYFHRETGGASLEANVAIILGNAAAGRADRRGARRLGAPRAGPCLSRVTRTVVCLGDVMTDVVLACAGTPRHWAPTPPLPSRSRPVARPRTPQPGWPPRGLQVVFVGRVGADPAGDAAVAVLESCRRRLSAWLRGRRAADRHLHGARLTRR